MADGLALSGTNCLKEPLVERRRTRSKRKRPFIRRIHLVDMKRIAIIAASATAATATSTPTLFLRSAATVAAVADRSLQSSAGGCNACIVEGVGYCEFQSYPDPNCLPNVCRCTPGEVDPCTKNECQRNCAAQNKKLCAHDGQFYCAGDLFYDSTCMTNTCSCNADGTVSCTKDAGECEVECYTDDDCTTAVRSQSAQPDLYPLCGCEARSALDVIASAYDECLGQGIIEGSSCAIARCTNTCQGYRAVCTNRKCDLVAPCAGDVRTCPDGAQVTRNAANDCEFDPCPESSSPFVVDPITGATSCKTDIDLCANGAAVDRDPANGCEFRPCPACNGEVFQCNDGSIVSRDSTANCAFESCADGTVMPPAPATEAGDDASQQDTSTLDEAPLQAAKLCFDSNGGNYLAPCKTSEASYCIGEAFTTDADGCRVCTCANSSGQVVCNDDACSDATVPLDSDSPSDGTDESTTLDQPTDRCTCIGIGGERFCPGDTFVAPDGCNNCACSVGGIASCTKKACLGTTGDLATETTCDDSCEGNDGNIYCAGDTFLSVDGCNTCICNVNGSASCTRMACITDEAPAAVEEKEEEEEGMVKEEEDEEKQEAFDFNTANGQASDTSTGALMPYHISAMFLGYGCFILSVFA